MKNLILTIDLLPKGSWNRDLSKTLSKKDWDKLRENCYKKANYCCEICGAKEEKLNAHEVWEFDVESKTQTLVDIVALCSKCHGVKHYRNSDRMGYGINAKNHFMRINKCSEMDFAKHLAEAEMIFEERNKILRWKMKVDLQNFGGKNMKFIQDKFPIINSPYEHIDWSNANHKINDNDKNMFYEQQITSLPLKKVKIYSLEETINKTLSFYLVGRNNDNVLPPKLDSILVDNYLGTITVNSDRVNKISWYLDDKLYQTYYNVARKFQNIFSAKNIEGKVLRFCLISQGGIIVSQNFDLMIEE